MASSSSCLGFGALHFRMVWLYAVRSLPSSTAISPKISPDCSVARVISFPSGEETLMRTLPASSAIKLFPAAPITKIVSRSLKVLILAFDARSLQASGGDRGTTRRHEDIPVFSRGGPDNDQGTDNNHYAPRSSRTPLRGALGFAKETTIGIGSNIARCPVGSISPFPASWRDVRLPSETCLESGRFGFGSSVPETIWNSADFEPTRSACCVWSRLLYHAPIKGELWIRPTPFGGTIRP